MKCPVVSGKCMTLTCNGEGSFPAWMTRVTWPSTCSHHFEKFFWHNLFLKLISLKKRVFFSPITAHSFTLTHEYSLKEHVSGASVKMKYLDLVLRVGYPDVLGWDPLVEEVHAQDGGARLLHHPLELGLAHLSLQTLERLVGRGEHRAALSIHRHCILSLNYFVFVFIVPGLPWWCLRAVPRL